MLNVLLEALKARVKVQERVKALRIKHGDLVADAVDIRIRIHAVGNTADGSMFVDLLEDIEHKLMNTFVREPALIELVDRNVEEAVAELNASAKEVSAAARRERPETTKHCDCPACTLERLLG